MKSGTRSFSVTEVHNYVLNYIMISPYFHNYALFYLVINTSGT